MKKSILALLAALFLGSLTTTAQETAAPAEPAVQAPAAPAVQAPATPAIQAPAAPAEPSVQTPAAPAVQAPAAPATNIPDIIKTISVDLPADTFRKVIQQAAARRDWVPVVRPDGVIRCDLSVRSHKLTVDILIDGRTYTVRYVSSQNLDYNQAKGKIHRKYHGWVNNLCKDISSLAVQLSIQ